MKKVSKYRICPVEHAGALDIGIRGIFQNPAKILRPFIKEGMSVLDLGCGPGFFTIGTARLVGNRGKVIGADIQDGMLERLRKKIEAKGLGHIVRTHKCCDNKIGLDDNFDMILVFYMLHEVPDKVSFLREIRAMLNPKGTALIVEPKFHVSETDFSRSIELMRESGFTVTAEPKIFLSRAVAVTAV